MKWLEDHQRTKKRRRLLKEAGDCPSCQHPWTEHSGAWPENDETCSECCYEIDHGERAPGVPPCTTRFPSLRQEEI